MMAKTNEKKTCDFVQPKKSLPGSIYDFEGPPLVPATLTMGLGSKYFDTMEQNRDKIHQLDATTGITETKGSVKVRAIQVATEMRARGIKENQVVVICSKSHLEQTIAVLACLFVGAIIAPLCSEMWYDDFKMVIGILQPKLAFCGLRSAGLLTRILKEKDLKCPIFVFRGAHREFLSFEKCFDNKVDPNFTTANIADPKRTSVFVVCTPGTECEPKLVSLSHYSLYMRYSQLMDYCKKNEKLVSFFPLSATMQILISCLCFETQAIIIFAGQFTERGACKYIYDLRIEHAFFETEFALRIIKNAPIQDFNMSFLKVIYIGGTFISAWNMSKLIKTFPQVRIRDTYRMCEVGAISVLSEEHCIKYDGKMNSVGKLLPGVIVRIIDVETKQVLGPNKWGQLFVKAPGIMMCYFRDPQATTHAFFKGFFRTGDVAQYDEDGFLYIRCRITDLISREGHTFCSLEVEEAILMFKPVAEVGVFSTNIDIIAVIVKKQGCDTNASAIHEFLSNILPEYMQPTKIEFTEFLPKTMHGIVKKHVLKENIIKLIREDSFYHAEHD